MSEPPKSVIPHFGSCGELRAHGVEMNAQYLIDGEEKYCKDLWSKQLLSLSYLCNDFCFSDKIFFLLFAR